MLLLLKQILDIQLSSFFGDAECENAAFPLTGRQYTVFVFKMQLLYM